MTSYIIKRVLASIAVIFIVSIFVFSIIHLHPGDPVVMALGLETPMEDIERVREEHHLNDPLPQQYITWIVEMFHGDFGDSLIEFRYHQGKTSAHFSYRNSCFCSGNIIRPPDRYRECRQKRKGYRSDIDILHNPEYRYSSVLDRNVVALPVLNQIALVPYA